MMRPNRRIEAIRTRILPLLEVVMSEFRSQLAVINVTGLRHLTKSYNKNSGRPWLVSIFAMIADSSLMPSLGHTVRREWGQANFDLATI